MKNNKFIFMVATAGMFIGMNSYAQDNQIDAPVKIDAQTQQHLNSSLDSAKSILESVFSIGKNAASSAIAARRSDFPRLVQSRV